MDEASAANRFGMFASIFTAVAGLVAFALAIIAVPVAGANCVSSCRPYPYMTMADRWPNDFMWLPPAILLVFGYLAVMAAIYSATTGSRRILGLAGLCLALVSATTLAIDYYLQLAVVPVSLQANETDGLPLLVMYNSHGMFVALEELGYLLMSVSFVFAASVLVSRGRLEAAVRWLFRVPLIAAAVGLAGFSIAFGLNRQDRFEVVILSVCWLTLIANGILLSVWFRRRLGAAAKV
jgi:hypothetical protein